MEDKKVNILINDKKITCTEGENLLWVALDNGIYIPHLCAIRERKEAYAACRLCFIEVEGVNYPVTACTTKVRAGMVINTKGERALRLARTALELLLSNHPVDCAHCRKSGLCALQKIAQYLRVKLMANKFKKILRERPIDETSSALIYEPQKCVLCGLCVWYCQEKLDMGTIGFAYRGMQRWVTTFNDQPIGLSPCGEQRELVDICPVGALVAKPKENKAKLYEGG